MTDEELRRRRFRVREASSSPDLRARLRERGRRFRVREREGSEAAI